MRRHPPSPRLVPLALALALLAGCTRSDHAPASTAEFAERAATPEAKMDERAAAQSQVAAALAGSPLAAGESVSAVTSRMLVRNVTLSLVVPDVDSSAAVIERLVAMRGGFVCASNTEDRDGFRYRHYTLRVPSAALDATLTGLRALAVRVSSETQSVQDVTEQAVDVAARLRTLRATENELIGLLREARARGRKVDDVMAIYRELTGIRTQIEQYEGRLESLKDLAALSTVTLVLAPDAATAPLQAQGWRPIETVKNSLRQLVVVLRGLGDFAIWAALVLLPIGALIAMVVIPLVAVGRRLARSAKRA
jgi:hypothetical protein